MAGQINETTVNAAPAVHQEGVTWHGTPEQLAALFSAIALAQGVFTDVIKDREVKIPTTKGPGYSFTYADFGQLLAATRHALSANGLAFIAPWSRTKAGVMTLHANLLHAAGGRMEVVFTTDVPRTNDGDDDVKTLGGTQTYLMRYAYRSMLALPGGEDLDEQPVAARGETGAQAAKVEPRKAQPPAQAPKGWQPAAQATPPQTPPPGREYQAPETLPEAPPNPNAAMATEAQLSELRTQLKRLGYSTRGAADARNSRALGKRCPADWIERLPLADVDVIMRSLVDEQTTRQANAGGAQ